MHSAQAQNVRVTEKIYFLFVGHHCRDITNKRINVYFIFVLNYRPIHSYVNTVGCFNVLSEILFPNSWRQSFSTLPIPKLSLHNSAAFLSSAKASQRFSRKSNFLTNTVASLYYTLSVSEYVTTNVKAKPYEFLHETNNQGCEMKMSIKSQTVLERSQKKNKPIISRPEKKPHFVCATGIPLSHRNILITKISSDIFFEIWIKSCLALCWSW